MSSILLPLNPQQRAAVEHETGPLLIFAGAGSGKTRVLAHRVAHLIQELETSPYHFLAVTFTNKAANEMRERIEGLIGSAPDGRGMSRGMWVGTFHAICARMLRTHGDRIGLDRQFVIFDAGDQQTLIKQALEELDLDSKRFRPQAIHEAISNAKNELIGPRRYETTASGFFEQIVSRVYHLYEKKLRMNHACDFDDLLMLAVQLLEAEPEIADHYQERFRHVLVDEYQDINYAQYRLVENIARKHRNICVVGDDDQSIYSWRGADVRLILQFEKDYPDATVIKLEQNYRSTQTILDAAYAVIRQNQHRKEKRLWTEKQGGDPLILHETANEQEEAQYVIEQIGKLREGQGKRLNDFAVLYRVNAQSRVLEEEFVKFRVPYRLVGAVQFYQRKEIKDILAYLKLLYNPNDSISLRRIINVPTRGIGSRTVEKLEAESVQHDINLMETIRQVASNATDSISIHLSPRASKAVVEFAQLFERLQEFMGDCGSITRLAEEVLKRTEYARLLEEERTLEAAERMENIKELLSATQEFDRRIENELSELANGERTEDDTVVATDFRSSHLGQFLEGVALVAEIDRWDESAQAVTLMTLHAAKGLEFPVVFMVGMEENVFPHSRSRCDTKSMEEERRLCYVGLTRAMEAVYLVHANRRTLYGMTEDSMLSQFVRDIPESVLQCTSSISTLDSSWWPSTRRSRHSDSPSHSASAASHRSQRQEELPGAHDATSHASVDSRQLSITTCQYAVGEKVRHGKWGDGIVVKVGSVASDSGVRSDEEQEWVEVAFPSKDIGIKKLMLSFAPLEKIS